MRTKYTLNGNHNQLLEALKWLRSNGELNKDFVLIELNYKRMVLEFIDDKLELMYTMHYDWKQ